MAKIPFNFGGGSGNGSDDCTAEAEDVLTNTTAIYKGSDDEPEEGAMANHSGVSLSSKGSLNTSSNRLEMSFPYTGKYNTSSKLYMPFSGDDNAASTLGIEANKIATGNTIVGVAGTYKGVGNATAAQVLAGKTFSTSDLSNATGTMTNVGSIDAAKSISLSNGTLYCRMTNGAHVTNASSGYPEVSVAQSTLASTIGLSASQIVYGNSILGISGTAISPGAVSTTGLELYAFGKEGITCNAYSSQTSGVISSTAGLAFKTSTCVAFGTVGYVSYNGTLVFSGASVDLGSYSTIHFQVRAIGGTHNWRIRVYYASSPPTSYSSGGNGTLAASKTLSLSNTSSTVDTLDISSLSGSYYLTFYPYNDDADWCGMILEHLWLT